GYHGDTSKTFLCGNIDDETQRLVRDGASFKKIGKRISDHVEKFRYGVVERFVGHGVGTIFHSEPIIYHCRK
ncbi:Methionine aminopeptidase, partial [Thalictrum thalictroides]